ncbi:serine hydrolase domain-containing protein [Loigolactobacillus rennini]|uniref:Beta-lactamase class C-like penicillin binding protein n=2 Tax=Loigolactobacillus rennini TaxID=238013 RepID=A0A0R2D8D8_9LACO|nr:serine hydrolase domain-containing protein [Loigolactobacillus rennini]KRN00174.1 beta-lactamase class C-like penicillin binding protein [Loigolactobacillus rennini DSM 20253]SFZ89095.1 Beta-lactamase class C and other penicillin binding proteins [Loigolactobacillus rennini]
MRGKVGRVVAVLLLITVIIGGGAAAVFYQKDSLAHLYLQKISGKKTGVQEVTTSTTKKTVQINRKAVSQQLKKDQFVGNVAILKNGKLIYQQPYGKDPDKNEKTKTTKYQLGDLQNALTAAAIMKLAAKGRLSLDTPVSHYYELNGATSEMTVGDLMNMTSGLTLDVTPSTELSTDVIPWNLANAVGQGQGAYSFQTVNYALLSGIVAQAAGISYQKYLDKILLQPAGTKQTGFVKSAAAQSKLVPAYSADNASKITQDTLFQTMNERLGTGQLYTTAGDLARLTNYMSSSDFLSKKQRTSGLFEENGDYTGRLARAGGQLTGEARFSGYASALAFSSNGQTGVVLMSNYQVQGDLSKTAQALLEQIND